MQCAPYVVQTATSAFFFPERHRYTVGYVLETALFNALEFSMKYAKGKWNAWLAPRVTRNKMSL